MQRGKDEIAKYRKTTDQYLRVSSRNRIFAKNEEPIRLIHMKRLLLLLLALTLNCSLLLAQNSDDFLDRYAALVEKVETLDNDGTDQASLEAIKKEYEKLNKEIETIRKEMTNKEIKQYYKLKARYLKKISKIKAKRGYSALKGVLEGIME